MVEFQTGPAGLFLVIFRHTEKVIFRHVYTWFPEATTDADIEAFVNTESGVNYFHVMPCEHPTPVAVLRLNVTQSKLPACKPEEYHSLQPSDVEILMADKDVAAAIAVSSSIMCNIIPCAMATAIILPRVPLQ